MAKLILQIFTISIFLSLVAFAATGEEDTYIFGKSINKKPTRLKKEKFSHFRFYWHDILSGSKPTSMMIIPPSKNTTTGFGQMNMIDNALTLGPELSSKIVGMAQGFYGAASLNDVGLMMYFYYTWSESGVREGERMAVIGGSGLFRFARGYVEASTHSWDFKTGDATVQYDAYVLHY
ncbi:hypothetical protein H5410_002063 [Solanum commersonii]|uniref:Dirigent protein n=1 Tax=Solanum commersonii TaxID=4109 RepID=A0A9J6B198_SOLCO|nr:hypothetical protein H5410_002063 [Solanum commersonii]